MNSWISGFMCGLFVWAGWLLSDVLTEPTVEEKQRTYQAIRVCVQRSDCDMNMQDWIDYYELHWEIEEKEVE